MNLWIEHNPKDSWQARRVKAIRRASSEPRASNISVASTQVESMPRLPQPGANDVITTDHSTASNAERLERQTTATRHRHWSAEETSIEDGNEFTHHDQQFRDEPDHGEKYMKKF